MAWRIPVTPGAYEVRLYFSELYSGAHGVGKRVFSVNVEGTQINNIDVFAEVGAHAAMMRSVIVNADAAIDIDFTHVKENPSLKGIEVIQLSDGGASNLAPTVSAGLDQIIDIADTLILTGSVVDDGLPDGTLDIQWSTISGPGSVSFTSPDQSYTTATFTTGGEYTLQLMAGDGVQSDSEQVSVLVTNNFIEPEPESGPGPLSVIRINAGGPGVSAHGVNWLSDSDAEQYVNTGYKYAKAVEINMSAVGAHVPEKIFQSERWDRSAAPEMAWRIPVTPGAYEVRLYFSELYSGAHGVGKRVFSVNVEGTQINNIDVFAEVGAHAAMMRSVIVNADAAIDIDFTHVKENPSLKGVEILPVGQNLQ